MLSIRKDAEFLPVNPRLMTGPWNYIQKVVSEDFKLKWHTWLRFVYITLMIPCFSQLFLIKGPGLQIIS